MLKVKYIFRVFSENIFLLDRGGVVIEWDVYLAEISEWSNISFEMAKYGENGGVRPVMWLKL